MWSLLGQWARHRKVMKNKIQLLRRLIVILPNEMMETQIHLRLLHPLKLSRRWLAGVLFNPQKIRSKMKGGTGKT